MHFLHNRQQNKHLFCPEIIVLLLNIETAEAAAVMFDEKLGYEGEAARDAYKNLFCWLGDQDLKTLAKKI